MFSEVPVWQLVEASPTLIFLVNKSSYPATSAWRAVISLQRRPDVFCFFGGEGGIKDYQREERKTKYFSNIITRKRKIDETSAAM